MFSKEELCNKIVGIFPELGKCNIEVKVDYDKAAKAWAVDLTKDQHHLKTFLDDEEANQCMAGIKCVNLGLQIGQLKKNIELV